MAADLIQLSQEEIKETFNYRDDGYLIWKKESKFGKRKSGSLAGCIDLGKRYWKIKINGKSYKAHRLIWFWHYGTEPESIDHIDRNTSNNKIDNLRAATIRENLCNRVKRSNMTSQYKGVFRTASGTWRARIRIPGRRSQFNLGSFKNEIDAAKSYDDAAVRIQGEFAVINFPKQNT